MDEPATHQNATPGRPAQGTGMELAAVLFLTVGSLLLPFLGWIVGLVLLWSSRLWTPRDKILGTLVWPGGLGSFFLIGALGPSQVCSSGETVEEDGTVTQLAEVCEGFAFPLWAGIPIMLALLFGPVVVAVLLVRRARERTLVGGPEAPRTVGRCRSS